MLESDNTVACSLSGGEMHARAAEARGLMDRALVARDRTADGARLRFRSSPEVDDAVRSLIRREKQCCPFFEFELRSDGDALDLTISAPPEASGLLDSLFAAA